ncbi:DMT family transporter [Billgrantia kenyensis]|uniref:DMT family transporter n=1 Tax=Billgrantia kenyensis TaxID=321266 RepID=A0A7W0ACG4_9GAMM|nr:DMT family transporter [Halomonas kenyensis]MBA2777534.1 DMT family transporter [Halomonas kenyensis]MCG6660204.1 DMT family transporter [Halomonas kenyensis]
MPELATSRPAMLTRSGITTLLLILAIGLFWGGNWPAVRFSLMQIPPFSLRAIGFTVGAVVLLGWAWLKGWPLRIAPGERLWLSVTGLFTILGFNLGTAFGQLHMPTSQAAIVAFTMPCWALLLAVGVLGERVAARQWLGLALGQGGLLVLLGPAAWQGGFEGLTGPLFVLAAALSWALGTVLIKRRGGWQGHPVVITGWQFALSAVPMVVLALSFESTPSPGAWQAATWLGLGYHLIFAICLAQMLWFRNVNRLSIGQSTISTLLIPVVGVASALILLGEPLTANLLLALALILASVAIVLTRREPASAA